MASPAITPGMMTPGNPSFLGLPQGAQGPNGRNNMSKRVPISGTQTGPISPGFPNSGAGAPPPPVRTSPAVPSGAGGPSQGGIVSPVGPQVPQQFSGPFTPQMLSMGPQAGNTSGYQGQDILQSNLDTENQNNLISKSSGITDFLSGNPTDSPLYKSLLSNSRSAIGNSYDSAVANTRASAASRGFGYESPAETGMESGMRAEEAGAFSQAPAQALQQTIAPELQAAQLESEQAQMYGQESMSEQQMATALQQARMGKSSSMTASMAGIVDAMMGASARANAAGA